MYTERQLPLRDPRVILLFAVLFGYVLWPILQVLAESVRDPRLGWTLEPWREFIRREHWRFALRSTGISVATVALAGVFGTALAFLYNRIEFPGRGIFAALTLLPFTLPPLVGVFAIWTLMAEEGLFHRLTRALTGTGFWIEKGYAGVLLIHVYSMFVFFYVMVGAAVAGFDESQIEASRDMGASRLRTLAFVMLPQMAPAFAGAALLVFMTSMASFTAPYFYMAGRPVLTVGIVQALESSQGGLASADCVVLAACAAIFLVLITRLERTHTGGLKGISRRRAVRLPLPAGLAVCAGCGLLTVVLVAPHLAMLRESMIRPGTGFIGRPVEFTLSNYTTIFRDAETLAPILTSLKAASLATVAVILFTLLSSWLDGRAAFRGKTLARGLIMLPWAMPGTVIAVALLWLSREPNPLTAGLPLRGTVMILALAYFIRLYPLSHRTLRAGLSRAPVELESAARDLGASPARSWLAVTLPLIAGAVVAAATLTFVTATGEFVSSILLYSPDTEPISVKIDQLRRGPGGMHPAAAYSTLLMLLITATFLAFGRKSGNEI